jgi:hypothetical protein
VDRGLLLCLNQDYDSKCYFDAVQKSFRRYPATEDTWHALANLYVSDKENFAGRMTQLAKENEQAFPKNKLPEPIDALVRPNNYSSAPEAPCSEPVYNKWEETWNIRGKKSKVGYESVTQNVVKIHPNAIQYINGVARFDVYTQSPTNFDYGKGHVKNNGSFSLTFSNSDYDKSRFLKVDN